jgi:hypothetical protein
MTIISLTRRAATFAAAAGALASPVAAHAAGGRPDNGHGRSSAAVQHGKGHDKAKHNPTVTYVFKGSVASVDDAAGTAVVNVAKVNRHAASTGGLTITFDLTKAKITVADVNADHVAGLADVTAGDRVLVQARLPRRSPDLSGTVAARKLVDQTRPAHTGAGATEQMAAG